MYTVHFMKGVTECFEVSEALGLGNISKKILIILNLNKKSYRYMLNAGQSKINSIEKKLVAARLKGAQQCEGLATVNRTQASVQPTQGQMMYSESFKSSIPLSLFANYICNYKHDKYIIIQCVPPPAGMFLLTDSHFQQQSSQALYDLQSTLWCSEEGTLQRGITGGAKFKITEQVTKI